MGRFARLAWPLLLVTGCDDDPAFQPLSMLCNDLAEDICDARAGGCCEEANPAACIDATRAQCQLQLDALTAEPLRYDAIEAAAKRRALRPQLDRCDAPPPLASFFTGGLPDGAACERDAQCSGGACPPDTGLCALALIRLCSVP
jgi:hypothetical protein